MRERAIVHIGGPQGAGKTTLVERLLERADTGIATVVRAVRDAKLRHARE